jgi:hypothetical protein
LWVNETVPQGTTNFGKTNILVEDPEVGGVSGAVWEYTGERLEKPVSL